MLLSKLWIGELLSLIKLRTPKVAIHCFKIFFLLKIHREQITFGKKITAKFFCLRKPL